jgi:ankyrin repeat protein
MKHLTLAFALSLMGCGQHRVAQPAEQTQTKSSGVIASHSDRTIEDLVRAAKEGDADSLIKLLQEPFDIHAGGEAILNEAVLAGQTRIVEILLQKGADPNSPDGRPLVANRHRDIALLLLRSGADPNLAPGSRPLYEAAVQGDLDVMRALMEKGANVDHNDLSWLK